MAAVQSVAGISAVTATFGRRAVGTVLKGRKALRVSCQGQSDGDGQQEAVDVLQSSRNPLLNLPREDLMAALGEQSRARPNDDVVAESVSQSSLTSSGQRRLGERVKFTAEKARLLRKENRASQTFHDRWYHSAIASKLAMPE